jgi:hypothetical protein
VSSLPPRDQRVVELASQIDLASFEIAFVVPSSDGTTSYITTSTHCSCPARVPCKHSAAVALRLQLAQAEGKAVCS